jgi:hypothetical protein
MFSLYFCQYLSFVFMIVAVLLARGIIPLQFLYYFLNDQWFVTVWWSYVFLRKMSIEVLCSFLKLGYLFFAVELCKFLVYFDTKLFSDIRFTNIFSQSTCCLFILLISFCLLCCMEAFLVRYSTICLLLFYSAWVFGFKSKLVNSTSHTVGTSCIMLTVSNSAMFYRSRITTLKISNTKYSKNKNFCF